MQVPFSELPGRHERHYRRKLGNILFQQPALEFDEEALLEVQRQDHEELVAFVDELRSVVARAVALKPNEESDVILKLKEDLDKAYEVSAGLAEDQSVNQDAIRQLLGIIMRTVRAAAAGDALAMQELGDEEQARNAHFELLQHSLVADVLHPQSVIGVDELAATLLSESASTLAAVLTLFDYEQTLLLLEQAQNLLTQRLPAAEQHPDPWERLKQIDRHLQALPRAAKPN